MLYVHIDIGGLFMNKQTKNLEEVHRTKESPEPYYAKRGEAAVLIIHGFRATPVDINSWARFLLERDFSVKTVLLAGHGTVPQDMEKVTWQDWYANVEQGLNELIDMGHSPIFVSGQSLGGTLTLHAAANRKEIAGIIPMCAPVFFKGIGPKLLPLIVRFKKYLNMRSDPTLGYDIERYTYEIVPTSSSYEVVKIANVVRKELPKIKIPAFIVQSGSDKTIDPENGRYIYEHIGSEKKELLLVEGAPHVITCHPLRSEVYPKAYEFLKSLME